MEQARRPAGCDDGKAFGRKAVPMSPGPFFLQHISRCAVFFVLALLMGACQSSANKEQPTHDYGDVASVALRQSSVPIIQPNFSFPLVDSAGQLPFTAPIAQRGSSDSKAVTGYFPHKVQADYAEGFRISYHKNYKLLEILKPFQDRMDTLRYALVPREIYDEVEVNNTIRIPIPVRSIIATSSTHIGLTGMLDANEIITGMAGADYVYNREIRKKIDTGNITAFHEGALNREKILALDPEVLLISGGQSSQFDNFRVLRNSGIHLLVNSEWLETTPLGKAEWVKVMAALLDKEKLANKKFDAVAERYERLKAAADTTGDKPLVINNVPYKGVWFVSGGESFTARFLRDAGADYPWYDSGQSGGLRAAYESVYRQGLKADIWLHPGTARTKEDLLAMDERFSDFKSFQSGRIYNHYRRSTPAGGNDYWETGVVRPDRVLADLIKIFHPEIMPGHDLYYYHKVE